MAFSGDECERAGAEEAAFYFWAMTTIPTKTAASIGSARRNRRPLLGATYECGCDERQRHQRHQHGAERTLPEDACEAVGGRPDRRRDRQGQQPGGDDIAREPPALCPSSGSGCRSCG